MDLTVADRTMGATFDAIGIGNYSSPTTMVQGDVYIDDVTYSAVVPEPSSVAMLGLAAGSLNGLAVNVVGC